MRKTTNTCRVDGGGGGGRRSKRIRRNNDDDPLTEGPPLVLSEDVLMEVFLRLPAKSLMRFRSLNKRWLDIISSDIFFTRRFRSYSPLRRFRLSLPPRFRYSRFSSLDMEGEVLSNFVFRPIKNCYWVLPTCFDLVCFSSDLGVHVCNPTTRELITIPTLDNNIKAAGFFGFGYVESTNEYKIVNLDVPQPHSQFMANPQIECRVFTLGMTEDSPSSYASPWDWKPVGNSPYRVRGDQYPAFVDGSLHWIINHDLHPEVRETIIGLSFDLEKEEFGLIPCPSGFAYLKTNNLMRGEQLVVLKGLQLVELRGLLCLSSVSCVAGSSKMEIWMFLKDSTSTTKWVKEYNIGLTPLIDEAIPSYVSYDTCTLHCINIIQDEGDEENIKLLLQINQRQFYYYHLQNQIITQLEGDSWHLYDYQRIAFYTESLHSLRHVLQKSFKLHQIVGVQVAHPPRTHVVRVFALFANSNINAYGGYLTNHKGRFVAIEGKSLDARDSIEAEAEAILYGLQLACGQGIQRIALVSRAKEMVDTINIIREERSAQSSNPRLEQILIKVTDLLSKFSWAQIFHDGGMSTQVACQIATNVINKTWSLDTEPPKWFIDGFMNCRLKAVVV